jgi:uncharacterized membrane protein HdeD (DUF308 family)
MSMEKEPSDSGMPLFFAISGFICLLVGVQIVRQATTSTSSVDMFIGMALGLVGTYVFVQTLLYWFYWRKRR